MPGRQGMPDTIKRSPEKAQRTWLETRESAINAYGDGRRAHQTAYAALKHSFEKVGDRWEPKKRKGPSDPRSKNPRARENRGKAYGGVDFEGHSKQELYERAAKLDISGRSRMTKGELAEAIASRQ